MKPGMRDVIAATIRRSRPSGPPVYRFPAAGRDRSASPGDVPRARLLGAIDRAEASIARARAAAAVGDADTALLRATEASRDIEGVQRLYRDDDVKRAIAVVKLDAVHAGGAGS